MKNKIKKWMSALPENCEICGKPFGKHVIDGKHVSGPWALMCEDCHKTQGCGLGIGRGQKYLTDTKEKVG